MSANLKTIIAQGTTVTAAIALMVGLSACANGKTELPKAQSKGPAPVEVAAAPPPPAADPMTADPLFAPPPANAQTSGGTTKSAAGGAEGGGHSQRVPLGQLSGNASQRVPLGALSGVQSDTKPTKATSAPLLIAPKPGQSSVAAAMDAPPPPTVAPAASASAVKSPPAKGEAKVSPAATASNYSVPQPESLKGAAKTEPAPQTVASAAEGKPSAPKKAKGVEGILDFFRGTDNKGMNDGTPKNGGPAFMVPPTASADVEKPKLKIPPKGSSNGARTPGDDETVIISSMTFAPPRETAQEFVPASLAENAPTDAASGSMIDRPMSAAEKNVAQRFEVLKTLLDEGLITPEEYSRHRAANIGALLPFTHDPASAGLERPSAGAEAIVARLQALRRALEIHAISTQQHASERSMILAALLPARPEDIATPIQPPADVIQGAAITSRLQTLRNRGLISADEFEAERKAIDQYLRTGSFKGAAAVADKSGSSREGAAMATAKEPKAGKKEAPPAAAVAAGAASAAGESETAEVTGPVLHLASFRTKEGAEKAWEEALAQNKSILSQYKEVIRKIDLGPGKGKFYRLMVGGFNSLADAESICIRLKANNQFCRASASASGS